MQINESLIESLKLRDYSKNLLNTLKLQQLNINKSVNGIFENDNSKTIKTQFNHLELNSMISDINNFKTNIATAAAGANSNISQKSVSFSEKLIASPRRRRAKSVPLRLGSTKLNKKTKKSVRQKTKSPRPILKRQYRKFDASDSDSMDDETKTLYYEINDFYLKNYEYSINLKDINKYDKKSLVECLTKTRQKYLNHDYDESNDSNLNFDEFKKVKFF
jgi:hypothetical protein